MRWGVLRRKSFALLFAGQAVSSLGDRLVGVALAFAVLDLTGSVTDLGLVIAAQTAPLLLFVLIGGVWADRLPRQRLMMGSDIVRAAAQGLSAAIVLSGSARIWELAALQAIYGTAEAFFGPASRVVVAQTVDRSELQEANALIGLSAELTSVAGPALAGVIVVAASAGWALAIDAATFVVSAIASRCCASSRLSRHSGPAPSPSFGPDGERSDRAPGCGPRCCSSPCSSALCSPRGRCSRRRSRAPRSAARARGRRSTRPSGWGRSPVR
jgi:MFS family permease